MRRSFLESVRGSFLIAGHLLTGPLLRRRRTHWGATDEEAAGPMAGDELIPDTRWSYTHAVTVGAPPEAVWPWLLQIGATRGGFYSYEGLENLIGCDIENVDELHPELQDLSVGDEVYLHPDAPPLRVESVDPPHALVLHGAPAEAGSETPASTWVFEVRPIDGGSRLLTRGRNRYGPKLVDRLFFGPTLIEPISFVMEQKMLETIKELAERRVPHHRSAW